MAGYCLTLLCTGSVSSAIATPTDVIKVRMQAKATEGLGGLYTVARDIYTNEGVRGLWRGVCPTAQRAALVAGVQLPVYDWTKSRLCTGPSALMQDGVGCHFLSSMVAGFSAALASNPVDVVRTRLMVQRRSANTVYKSAVHCGLHTIGTEGVTALFKGFVPSFARMGPWNVIFFVVYEKLKSLKL
jgi:solute carrier family 25 protein 14/30